MSTGMHMHNTDIHIERYIYLQRSVCVCVCVCVCVYDYWLNILSYLLYISVVLRDEQKQSKHILRDEQK